MKESKIHATERLRREGLWDEASAFRDQERQRLKAEGMGKAEASSRAWQAMIEAYAPQATRPSAAESDGGVDEAAAAALAERVGDRPADLIRDVLWTYENLERSAAVVAAAPSLGAWSMLKWAHENRNRFFEQLLPKALQHKANDERTAEAQFVPDVGKDEILRLLQELREPPAAAALVVIDPRTLHVSSSSAGG